MDCMLPYPFKTEGVSVVVLAVVVVMAIVKSILLSLALMLEEPKGLKLRLAEMQRTCSLHDAWLIEYNLSLGKQTFFRAWPTRSLSGAIPRQPSRDTDGAYLLGGGFIRAQPSLPPRR